MNTDLRQCKEYQEFLCGFGGCFEDLGGGEVGYITRLWFFPFLKIMIVQAVSDPLILSRVDHMCRRYRMISVRVLPKAIVGTEQAAIWDQELREHGYSLDKYSIAPTKTVVVDLALGEEDLLSQMKSKTRYNVRLAERRGVKVEVVDGITIGQNLKYLDEFHSVYSQNSKRIGVGSAPKEWFGKLFETFGQNLFVVYAYLSSGEIGAVGCYIVTEDTVWYQMNGTTEAGRKDFAANIVVWEGMLEGKRRGCKWYDFDGIYDERYDDDTWKGFSRFKLGFGGVEITYLGSYIKKFPFLKR